MQMCEEKIKAYEASPFNSLAGKGDGQMYRNKGPIHYCEYKGPFPERIMSL